MLPERLLPFTTPIPVLDDGHIQLVDVMGDDLAVVDAARVSFFGHSGEHTEEENRHLLRYLMRERHCYDAQTEVLTDKGFVRWPDVQKDMKLGIWDNEAGTLCYEEPEYLTRYPYRGDMYRVDHGGVDLLVTPEHSMWVRLKDQWDAATKSQGWSGYRLIPAIELGDRSCVRYSKLAPMVAPAWTGEGFPPCKDPQALLELIGFFIGDGSARGSRANGIDFHLKKNREIKFLHDCVERVGWVMKEFPSYGGRRKFCVYAKGIGHLFEQMFYWNDEKKHLPDWCLRLDRDDAAALLDGMRHSDGSEKRGAWVYCTGSARLAEQVQILGLHAGEACHIGRSPSSDCYNPPSTLVETAEQQGDDEVNQRIFGTPPRDAMYRVMFLSRMREPVVNQGKTQTSRVPYDGTVYCAKTRTGILVVRRNGKIVLSGNSSPFEMCEIKLRVRVPMDCWRQWIRHRTANVNESSTRYAPAIDSAQRASEWRAQSKNNKQGSDGLVTDWPEGFDLPGYLDEDLASQLRDAGPAAYLSDREERVQAFTREVYEERLAFGVARELARKDLPLSTYTEAYWKIDLHNLFHFLGLRLDPHAQKEIREYATAIAEIVKVWVPWAWEAFEDYRLNGMYLSRAEVEGLRGLLMQALEDKRSLWAGAGAGLGDPDISQKVRDNLIGVALRTAGVQGREKRDLESKLISLLKE